MRISISISVLHVVDAGVKLGEACTIVLRGATQQILDEAERSLHDALCVLSQTVKETKTVFGGGMYREALSAPSEKTVNWAPFLQRRGNQNRLGRRYVLRALTNREGDQDHLRRRIVPIF